MRGRKKKDKANIKSFTIKITEEQHQLIKKNECIRKDIINNTREYLNLFLGGKNTY
ncbi:hypothetical protein [uncultured Clostridium sp.]|uniref:hypothetical protein n=1 Tax=uncultured Clostridium sp. TaxID=59620 RepID=UPI00262EFDC8|nr:hypothetical protein [uncultured Clostridium sp.]